MRISENTEINRKILKLMASKFPKFSKVSLSMINNKAYGVDFSTPAKRYLKKHIPEMKTAQRKLNNEKRSTKTITIRIDNTEYEKYATEASEAGVSLNEYMKEKLHGLHGRM